MSNSGICWIKLYTFDYAVTFTHISYFYTIYIFERCSMMHSNMYNTNIYFMQVINL